MKYICSSFRISFRFSTVHVRTIGTIEHVNVNIYIFKRVYTHVGVKSMLFIKQSVANRTVRLSPFMPACTNTCPLHILTSFTPTYTHYRPLCLLAPFLHLYPIHACSCPYLVISSLYILCQYLDQPAHYHQYHDQNRFACNVHNRYYFCETIETRGSSPSTSCPLAPAHVLPTAPFMPTCARSYP